MALVRCAVALIIMQIMAVDSVDMHRKLANVHKGKAVEKARLHCTGARRISHMLVTDNADGFIS